MKAEQDTLFSRFITNSAFLLSGNAVADLCTIAATLITARSLGPDTFGTLVLIQTYVVVVKQLFDFQSWQALVKFGADKLTKDDEAGFSGLVALCVIFDTAAALLATAAALLLLRLVAGWYDWEESIIKLGSLYCLIILCSMTDTAVGILRICNKFQLLAGQHAAVAAAKLLAVIGAFFLCQSLTTYLVIWLAAEFFSTLLLSWAGIRAMQQRFPQISRPQSLTGVVAENPGIMSFLWTTNLHTAIRLTSREADILIVGGLLGESGAALLKIVKQIAAVFMRISDPLYNAIYPELAQLWSTGKIDQLIKLIYRSFWIAAIPCLLLWLALVGFGKPALLFFLGPAYTPVYLPATIYTLAVLIAVITFSYHPLMLAMGKTTQALKVLIFCTTLYYSLLFPLIHRFQVEGVAAAYLCFYLTWAGLMTYILIRAVTAARRH